MPVEHIIFPENIMVTAESDDETGDITQRRLSVIAGGDAYTIMLAEDLSQTIARNLSQSKDEMEEERRKSEAAARLVVPHPNGQ